MSAAPGPDGVTPATFAITGGRMGAVGRPLNVPIGSVSSYVHGTDRAYARAEVPDGHLAVEELVGGLEGGDAVVFGSGMAAITAVFDPLPVGARIAIPSDGYQGTAMLAARGAAQGRWTLTTVDVTDTAGWVDALATCDLVWLESPSNPLLEVADLAALGQAPRRGLLAVDNTVATPLVQRPLELGADVVVHSATKFLGGHADLLAGVVVVRDADLAERTRLHRTLTGANIGGLEAFLLTRGIRTLGLRVERGTANAVVLADRLRADPRVAVVRHPGVTALLSFDVVGEASDTDAFLTRLRVVRHATSLGGVETTAERRAGHAGQEHLPATLVRMSVGCEDVEDLWRDLDAALG